MIVDLNSKTWRRLRLMQFFLAIALFTFFALVPGGQIDVRAYNDKVMHFLGNFALYFSAWAAYRNRFNNMHLFLILIPYSVAMEFSQLLSPGRAFDLRDLAANLSGLATGLLLTFALERLYSQYKARQLDGI